MKKYTKNIIIGALVALITFAPWLKFSMIEQDGTLYTNNYSIADSLEMDIAEQVFNTPYVILEHFGLYNFK